jgi:hypothetical protein
LLAAAALLWAGAAQAQQIQSPADLFPASALAYAEVRQPAQLAKEVGALFRGSSLGNLPGSLSRVGAKYEGAGAFALGQELKITGLMLSPEVVKEVGRLKGAGVAFTLGKDGDLEWVAVVLTGTSQAPAFFMRTYLTMAPVRVIDKVAGVPVYRAYFPTFERVPPPAGAGGGRLPTQGDPLAKLRYFGPAAAMAPGVVFLGTPEAVKDAVRRAKGKAEGDALSKSEAFQEASGRAGNEPGLFGYGNVAAMVKAMQAMAGPAAEQINATVGKMLNFKAFRSVVYTITLAKGTLRYREMALLNPKEKSPLLQLLPPAPANADLLHYAPKDAVMIGALNNADGEKRWADALRLADAMAGAGGGGGGLPSQQVKQLEQALGVDLGKDVAGKISNFAFGVGDPLKAPVKKRVEKGPGFESVRVGPEVPMVFVLQITDEESAGKMVEQLLPRILGMIAGGKGGQPTTAEMHGQKVHSVKMPGGEGFHYGRHGNVIVLGPYKEPVARALKAGAEKAGWLAGAKHADKIKELRDAPVFVAFRPATAIVSAYTIAGYETRQVKAEGAIEKGLPAVEPPPVPQPRKGAPENGSERPPVQGNVTVKVEDLPPSKEVEQLKKSLGKVLASEELATFTISRKDDRVVEEARIGGLNPLVARLTDFLVEQYLQLRMTARPLPTLKAPAVEKGGR